MDELMGQLFWRGDNIADFFVLTDAEPDLYPTGWVSTSELR